MSCWHNNGTSRENFFFSRENLYFDDQRKQVVMEFSKRSRKHVLNEDVWEIRNALGTWADRQFFHNFFKGTTYHFSKQKFCFDQLMNLPRVPRLELQAFSQGQPWLNKLGWITKRSFVIVSDKKNAISVLKTEPCTNNF